MLKVFIDTNIFLDFYRLNDKEIEQLKKLLVLIENKEIEIILSQNVIDEYNKNRLKVIHNTISDFTKQTEFRIPNILKTFSETQELESARKLIKEKTAELLEKFKQKVAELDLSADLIVQQIFTNSNIIEVTTDLLKKAEIRFIRRFPPRKKDSNDSIGDAINWITLLENIANGDLHIISEDKDYRDSLYNDNDIASFFLSNEWKNLKDGKLFVYRDLKGFFDEKFVTYNFEIDEEKKQEIEDLINSPNFVCTHSAIEKLSLYSYSDFSIKEINDIINAYIENPQIHWIITDDDVKFFILNLIKNKEEVITPKYKEIFALIQKQYDQIKEQNTLFDDTEQHLLNTIRDLPEDFEDVL